MTIPASTAIGATILTLTELSSIGLLEPLHDWYPGTELRQLHSGKRKWVGPPHGSLTWGFLEQAQRESLRTLLPDTTNAMYIRTKTRENSDEWKYYLCEIYWPEEPREAATVNKRINFVLELNFMVEQDDPEEEA